jgi:hypothetical protein
MAVENPNRCGLLLQQTNQDREHAVLQNVGMIPGVVIVLVTQHGAIPVARVTCEFILGWASLSRLGAGLALPVRKGGTCR